MKVILLSGSPRKGGNTEQVLNACAETIKEQGLEAEVISLAGKKITSCIACGSCRQHNFCAIKDDLNDIMPKVQGAEGFIVGAPVYYGTARGDLMSAVQRIAMVAGNNDSWLQGKVGGPIAVARRGGLTATIQEMLMFYFISGMVVPGSDYWNIVFGKEIGAAMEDEEGLKTSKQFAKNVALLVKKLYPNNPIKRN